MLGLFQQPLLSTRGMKINKSFTLSSQTSIVADIYVNNWLQRDICFYWTWRDGVGKARRRTWKSRSWQTKTMVRMHPMRHQSLLLLSTSHRGIPNFWTNQPSTSKTYPLLPLKQTCFSTCNPGLLTGTLMCTRNLGGSLFSYFFPPNEQLVIKNYQFNFCLLPSPLATANVADSHLNIHSSLPTGLPILKLTSFQFVLLIGV